MTPRTAVAVVAFNRPHYFLATLRSILRNAELAACDLWIFLDGGAPVEQKLQCQIAAQELSRASYAPRRVEIIRRRNNLDCGRHLIAARRRLFDQEGYRYVYLFEDDMVVSPHYLAVCRRMLEWSQANYWNVGVVQAYNSCWLTAAQKSKHLRGVFSANSHWWGYLLSADTWNQISSLLYVYEAKFLMGRPYRKRDIARISRWVQSHIADYPDNLETGTVPPGKAWFTPAWDFRSYFATDTSLGQDAMTALALALVGKQKLVPVVNRGLPIGRLGIHSTDANFERRGFDRVQLDLFDSDAHLAEFEPMLPAPQSHTKRVTHATSMQPYMRRDEEATIVSWLQRQRPRRVLEFGAGGSTVVFSQLVAETQWWTMEHSDLWINRVLDHCSDATHPNLTLLACSVEQLPTQLDKLLADVPFELYVVDGYDRPYILQRLSRQVRQHGGRVLLHDYARPEYQPGIGEFAQRQELAPAADKHQGWLLLSH